MPLNSLATTDVLRDPIFSVTRSDGGLDRCGFAALCCGLYAGRYTSLANLAPHQEPGFLVVATALHAALSYHAAINDSLPPKMRAAISDPEAFATEWDRQLGPASARLIGALDEPAFLQAPTTIPPGDFLTLAEIDVPLIGASHIVKPLFDAPTAEAAVLALMAGTVRPPVVQTPTTARGGVVVIAPSNGAGITLAYRSGVDAHLSASMHGTCRPPSAATSAADHCLFLRSWNDGDEPFAISGLVAPFVEPRGYRFSASGERLTITRHVPKGGQPRRIDLKTAGAYFADPYIPWSSKGPARFKSYLPTSVHRVLFGGDAADLIPARFADSQDWPSDATHLQLLGFGLEQGKTLSFHRLEVRHPKPVRGVDQSAVRDAAAASGVILSNLAHARTSVLRPALRRLASRDGATGMKDPVVAGFVARWLDSFEGNLVAPSVEFALEHRAANDPTPVEDNWRSTIVKAARALFADAETEITASGTRHQTAAARARMVLEDGIRRWYESALTVPAETTDACGSYIARARDIAHAVSSSDACPQLRTMAVSAPPVAFYQVFGRTDPAWVNNVMHDHTKRETLATVVKLIAHTPHRALTNDGDSSANRRFGARCVSAGLTPLRVSHMLSASDRALLAAITGAVSLIAKRPGGGTIDWTDPVAMILADIDGNEDALAALRRRVAMDCARALSARTRKKSSDTVASADGEAPPSAPTTEKPPPSPKRRPRGDQATQLDLI